MVRPTKGSDSGAEIMLWRGKDFCGNMAQGERFVGLVPNPLRICDCTDLAPFLCII